MAGLFSFLHLNIRQKIVLAFLLSLIASLLIGVVGYRQLLRVENKLRLVEIANGFHNAILEVRRYEKNFLLYGLEEDFQQDISYLDAAEGISKTINREFGELQGIGQITRCQSEMGRYRQLLNTLADAGQSGYDIGQRQATEAQLREIGKNLVELSLQLTKFEHNRIVGILRTLKTHFAYALGIILCLGIFLTVLVTRQILIPLGYIEKATLKIARGEFVLLPVHHTHDETSAVIEAFNKMVTELENHQDQLVQAQKLSSLGILSSGIAHQLNNPLNNISTSCQLLMEEIDSGDKEFVRRLLNNINQEADRTRDIVKGLLDFSREREFQLDWANLNNTVIQTIRLVSSELPSGVEITTDIPEDLNVYADCQRLQEVFLNLLINAAQSMPDGEGHVHISSVMRSGERDEVEIKIKDTGIGIPTEDLPHIFDPFFSTKEVGLGTGLGLSVVYGIIDRHGGTITVESKVGAGTVFTIKLPLKGKNAFGENSP